MTLHVEGSSAETVRGFVLTHEQAVMLHHALYMTYGNDAGGLWISFRAAMGPAWDQVVADSAKYARGEGL